MKTIIANQGVQLALLSIIIGIVLTALGTAEGTLLTGAGAAYLIGKLQARPKTIAKLKDSE